jgi:hypothetical protein
MLMQHHSAKSNATSFSKLFPLPYQAAFLETLALENLQCIKHLSGGEPVCFWPYIQLPGKVQSPSHLFFSNPWGQLDHLASFLTRQLNHLKSQGIGSIQFYQAPLFYPFQHEFREVYLQLGFQELSSEPIHYIPIDHEMLEDKIHISEVRRIAKCAEEGMRTQRIGLVDLPAAFAVIEQWKNERGHQSSTNELLIQQQASLFPESFHLYCTSLRGKPAAYGFFIQLCSGIWHYFLSATDPQWDSHSPITQLLSTVYIKAKLRGVHTLDLGPSLLQGEPNLGLINFKERMGGHASQKICWELNL